jgi:hypothetical protein
MTQTAGTRSFRLLTALGRPHGAVMRGLAAAVVWPLVLVLTGRAPLAQEATLLCWRDQFKTCAHRVSWYLHHGWAARFTGTRVPLFDPTTDMRPRGLAALDRWLAGRTDARHQLTKLYLRARQITDARDAGPQAQLMADYARIATGLLPLLPAPNPQAKADKGADFTRDDACTALRSLQVISAPWYIISGTFLGAVREGRFLSHDYDIDIGIHAEDYDATAVLAQIAAAPDLVLINTSPHLEMRRNATGLWHDTPRPALLRVLHATGIGIDIFIHHLEPQPQGNLRWHGSAKHRWDNHAFDLADYTIDGIPVRGPADADCYLTENYGDWRTPVKSFDCSTGTPNVSFPRNLAAIAEVLRTAILPARARETEVARLILMNEGYIQQAPGTGPRFVIPWTP